MISCLADDDTKKKIKVEIKPLSNGDGSGGGGGVGSSVDELQRAVGGLELVPPPLVSVEQKVPFWFSIVSSLLSHSLLFFCSAESQSRLRDLRPQSALNDRIGSGTQTLRVKVTLLAPSAL